MSTSPIRGAPPEEKWQCQATRRCGKRCRKWHLRGSNYCEYHGGRRRDAGHVMLKGLPVFYSKRLTKTLRDVIEKETSRDPSQQFDLLQELALMRQAASESVALYSATTELPSNASNDMMRQQAAMLMSEALKNVAQMCQVASVIADKAEKLDAVTLRSVIAQITRIAYDCFDGDPRAVAFEAKMREHIKLPSSKEHAVVTPDEQVRQMMEATIGDQHS